MKKCKLIGLFLITLIIQAHIYVAESSSVHSFPLDDQPLKITKAPMKSISDQDPNSSQTSLTANLFKDIFIRFSKHPDILKTLENCQADFDKACESYEGWKAYYPTIEKMKQLHHIFSKYKALFDNDPISNEQIHYRLRYVFGLLFNDPKATHDDFVIESAHRGDPICPQLFNLLADVLKISPHTCLSLRANYYAGIYEMNTDNAYLLGQAIGQSSIQKMYLQGTHFAAVPRSLAILVREISRNADFQTLDLSKENYSSSLAETYQIVQFLTKNVSTLNFNIILPHYWKISEQDKKKLVDQYEGRITFTAEEEMRD